MKIEQKVLSAKKLLLSTLQKYGVCPTDKVLVGFSGGQDSLALLLIASSALKNVGAVVVNHNILKNAKTVATQVKNTALKIGIQEIFVENVEIGTLTNLEKKAREKRYLAFEKVLSQTKAKCLLLAHTKDDQAETVFLNLIRGSGINALKGIPEKRNNFIRPFLSLSRQDTLEICKYYKQKPWHDPSNRLSENAPLRVKIREEIIPQIEKITKRNIRDNLYRTAIDAQNVNNYIMQVANQNKTLQVSKLKKMHSVVRKQIIRMALLEKGANPSKLLKKHIEQVEKLILTFTGQKQIEVPGNVSIIRSSAGKIVILNDR
jgi:tRNA(Ile)-lysidine synthase